MWMDRGVESGLVPSGWIVETFDIGRKWPLVGKGKEDPAFSARLCRRSNILRRTMLQIFRSTPEWQGKRYKIGNSKPLSQKPGYFLHAFVDYSWPMNHSN